MRLNRKRWFRENLPPYECYFCGLTVVGIPELHHIDHDRKNNLWYNLVVVHPSCHDFYHSIVNKIEAKPMHKGAAQHALWWLDKKQAP